MSILCVAVIKSCEQNSDVEGILKNFYFSGKTSYDLYEICRTFLKKYGFSAFEFERVFDDGTSFMLYTDSRISNYVIKNRIHVTAHFPEALIRDRFWYVLPKASPYFQMTSDIKQMTGSCTFSDFIVRHEGYYDMFCFWSPSEFEIAANQIINLKSECERFAFEFQENAKDIIKSADRSRFAIPTDMLPNIGGIGSFRPANPIHNDTISSVLTFIERNLFDPIQLETIANSANMSQSTLTRHFKQEFKQTPYSYIRNRRLDEAMKFLTSGRYSVSHVAMQVGYDNFGAFSEAFKGKFKKPPSFFIKK